MKPSEWKAFKRAPVHFRAYRAHRLNETDWISYTLDKKVAERFARKRGVSQITEYELRKKNVVALFLRRDEQEVLMLDSKNAKKIVVHKLEG